MDSKQKTETDLTFWYVLPYFVHSEPFRCSIKTETETGLCQSHLNLWHLWHLWPKCDQSVLLKKLQIKPERVTEVTSSKLWLFWYSRRVCTNLVKVIRFSNQHFRRSFGSRRFVRISKSFANSPSKFQGSSFCRLDSSRYQHRTGVYQETSTISIRFLFFFLLMVLNTFQTSLD